MVMPIACGERLTHLVSPFEFVGPQVDQRVVSIDEWRGLARAVVSSAGARVDDIGSLPEEVSHDDKPKRVVSWTHIVGVA
jgi:hypothetical protein